MEVQGVILNSLIIVAVHALFWPGMLLFKLVAPLSKLPVFIKKPFYDCMICMSSIWGIGYFIIIHGLPKTPDTVVSLCMHVLAVCGCNVILDSSIYYWRRGGNRLKREGENQLL